MLWFLIYYTQGELYLFLTLCLKRQSCPCVYLVRDYAMKTYGGVVVSGQLHGPTVLPPSPGERAYVCLLLFNLFICKK
jgi:hypothetical protein